MNKEGSVQRNQGMHGSGVREKSRREGSRREQVQCFKGIIGFLLKIHGYSGCHAQERCHDGESWVCSQKVYFFSPLLIPESLAGDFVDVVHRRSVSKKTGMNNSLNSKKITSFTFDSDVRAFWSLGDDDNSKFHILSKKKCILRMAYVHFGLWHCMLLIWTPKLKKCSLAWRKKGKVIHRSSYSAECFLKVKNYLKLFHNRMLFQFLNLQCALEKKFLLIILASWLV